MTDHDPDLDAILDQVAAAGLVDRCVDDEGRPAMRLTPDGVRVARQLAMPGEDGQDDLMVALLGRRCQAREGPAPRGMGLIGGGGSR